MSLTTAFQQLDDVKRRVIKVTRPSTLETLKEKEKELTNIILKDALTKKRVVKIVPPAPEFLARVSRPSINSDDNLTINRSMPPRKSTKLKPVPEDKDKSDESNEDKPIVAAKFFEKKTEVLSVDHVEIVHLVLHEHAGKSYYRDPIKNKLFTRLGPKSVGLYIGRWDARNERIITDIPDSDSE